MLVVLLCDVLLDLLVFALQKGQLVFERICLVNYQLERGLELRFVLRI